MADFKLSINLDNAAFDTGEANDDVRNGGELYRILQKLATEISDEFAVEVGDSGSLRDANGNTVGKWEVIENG